MKTDNRKQSFPTLALSLFLCFGLIYLFTDPIGFAHGWKAPKKEAEAKNPIEYSEESVSRGKAGFLELCADCHGKTAEGGNAQKYEGKMVPPNLVKRLAGHSDGDFFWKIETGRGDMPAFGDEIDSAEIWDIINFIRSLSLK